MNLLDKRWRNLVVIIVVVLVLIGLYFLSPVFFDILSSFGTGEQSGAPVTLLTTNIVLMVSSAESAGIDGKSFVLLPSATSESLTVAQENISSLENLDGNETAFKEVLLSRITFYKNYLEFNHLVDSIGPTIDYDVNNFNADCVLVGIYSDLVLNSELAKRSMDDAYTIEIGSSNVFENFFADFVLNPLNYKEIETYLDWVSMNSSEAISLCS